MGTNYYLTRDACPHCGRGEKPMHIGKSSAGWCFSLRVTDDWDEPEVKSLADWETLWAAEGAIIRDEYGDRVTPEEMRRIICERSRPERPVPHGYSSWAEFHRMNHSVPGPAGLSRHSLTTGFCVAHGEGTYDLVKGEFS